MATFETFYQTDNIQEIVIKGHFKEIDAHQLAELLEDLCAANEVDFCIIDLSQHHVLPLRALGSKILQFYRNQIYQTPVFIALVVQPSLAQVLNSVIKTLMRREQIQIFTDMERAYQWLELEREKLA